MHFQSFVLFRESDNEVCSWCHSLSYHRFLQLLPSQVCSSLAFILSVSKLMNHWLENEFPLDLNRMFGIAERPCFHPSSIKLSWLCVCFGDGYTYNRCQQQLKWEQCEGAGRGGYTDWKNTIEVSSVVDLEGYWIFGDRLEKILDDGSFEDLKHLHASELITCEHNFKSKRLAHTRDSQLSWLNSLQGLRNSLKTSCILPHMFAAQMNIF